MSKLLPLWIPGWYGSLNAKAIQMFTLYGCSDAISTWKYKNALNSSMPSYIVLIVATSIEHEWNLQVAIATKQMYIQN